MNRETLKTAVRIAGYVALILGSNGGQAVWNRGQVAEVQQVGTAAAGTQAICCEGWRECQSGG